MSRFSTLIFPRPRITRNLNLQPIGIGLATVVDSQQQSVTATVHDHQRQKISCLLKVIASCWRFNT